MFNEGVFNLAGYSVGAFYFNRKVHREGAESAKSVVFNPHKCSEGGG